MLPRETWRALEADLLRCGFVLADIPRRVSWRAVVAFVAHLPRESATAIAAIGERARWGDSEHLLASLVDLMHLSVWMNSRDGQKGRNRPKALKRPGEKREGRTYGSGRYTPQELTEMFGW